jgi:hypothetical protein
VTIRRARKRHKPRFRRASYEQEQAKRKERAHGAWVGIVRAKMKRSGYLDLSQRTDRDAELRQQVRIVEQDASAGVVNRSR